VSKVIKFSNTTDFNDLEKPAPASTFIPNWYKDMESYIEGKKTPNGIGKGTGTIKRCMPVFDAIISGYIIILPADVMVSLKNGEQYFEWANFNLVSFHPVEQAPSHPERKPYSYPKWINPWAIKTPKGYSTMFVQPMHRESVFTILPGIVDTDRYTAPVNFPFVINDPKFEGLIPKGTPIAQVIPFKRDSFKMEFGGQEELIEQTNIEIKIKTKFFDAYKTMFWHRKEYK
jgi:hypothetical protein